MQIEQHARQDLAPHPQCGVWAHTVRGVKRTLPAGCEALTPCRRVHTTSYSCLRIKSCLIQKYFPWGLFLDTWLIIDTRLILGTCCKSAQGFITWAPGWLLLIYRSKKVGYTEATGYHANICQTGIFLWPHVTIFFRFGLAIFFH